MVNITNYRHTKAKSLIPCRQGTHCAKMGADSLAEKIPQMPHNLSAQFDYLSPKVLEFTEKRLHWTFIGMRDLIRFFEDETQIKIPSEIIQPLTAFIAPALARVKQLWSGEFNLKSSCNFLSVPKYTYHTFP